MWPSLFGQIRFDQNRHASHDTLYMSIDYRETHMPCKLCIKRSLGHIIFQCLPAPHNEDANCTVTMTATVAIFNKCLANVRITATGFSMHCVKI